MQYLNSDYSKSCVEKLAISHCCRDVQMFKSVLWRPICAFEHLLVHPEMITHVHKASKHNHEASQVNMASSSSSGGDSSGRVT